MEKKNKISRHKSQCLFRISICVTTSFISIRPSRACSQYRSIFFVCVYFVLVKSKEEFACHLCITKGLDPSQANIISGIPNATTAVYKTTAISVMPQHTRTNAPQSRQHTYIRIYIEYGSGMTRASCSTRKI